MQYAILCYHDEKVTCAWSKEHDDAVMAKPLVIDGPFAETKEQLLGFYVVDCASLEEAIEIAKELGAANPGGAHEIRPVGVFFPAKVAS